MKTSSWVFDKCFPREFHSLNDTLAIKGELVSKSRISYLLKTTIEESVFYVKVYTGAGKHLRRLLGRSRVRGEWENLLFFQSLGIPVPHIVAYGETRQWGLFTRGILVTQEVPGAIDLAQLTPESRHIEVKSMRLGMLKRVAFIARKLHDAGFIHNDFKWRNILVSDDVDSEIYLLDCPLGATKMWPFLKRGKIKDLACLDKVGRKLLSQTDRLRFYQWYRDIAQLDKADKLQIRQIVCFFDGRD